VNERARSVVVSGGTGGLGRALCLQFAEQGYHATALYHSDGNAARSLAAELEARRKSGACLRQDITSPIPPGSWLGNGENPPDVLIHNACAPFTPGPLHLTDWEAFEAQLSVTLKGAYYCAKEALRLMVPRQRGTIVNVLSEGVRTVPKGFSAYLSAKFALDGFTKALAKEYRGKGIRVFSVAPSFMLTPLTKDWNAAFQSGGAAPKEVAREIFDLVHDLSLPAEGEVYFPGVAIRKPG
jgi:3-oxoacyl-[acyl-carrier protein] reductase